MAAAAAAAPQVNPLSVEFHDLHKPEWFQLATAGSRLGESSHSKLQDAAKAFRTYIKTVIKTPAERDDYIKSAACRILLKHALLQGLSLSDKKKLDDYDAAKELRKKNRSKRQRDDDEDELAEYQEGKALNLLRVECQDVNKRLNSYVARVKDAAFPQLKEERDEKREEKKQRREKDVVAAPAAPAPPPPARAAPAAAAEPAPPAEAPPPAPAGPAAAAEDEDDDDEDDDDEDDYSLASFIDNDGDLALERRRPPPRSYPEVEGLGGIIPPAADSIFVTSSSNPDLARVNSSITTYLEGQLANIGFPSVADFNTGCLTADEVHDIIPSYDRPFAYLVLEVHHLHTFLLHPTSPSIILNYCKGSYTVNSFWVCRGVVSKAVQRVKCEIGSLEFL